MSFLDRSCSLEDFSKVGKSVVRHASRHSQTLEVQFVFGSFDDQMDRFGPEVETSNPEMDCPPSVSFVVRVVLQFACSRALASSLCRGCSLNVGIFLVVGERSICLLKQISLIEIMAVLLLLLLLLLVVDLEVKTSRTPLL